MDDRAASAIAEHWSGGAGLVPRGPRMLLACVPALPSDAERLTGCRADPDAHIWRLEVGGRFLHSGGLVYPGGVPYPEELQHETPVVANEVWLYVDQDTSRVIGAYWWPDAIRRPIASVPQDDFADVPVVHPSDAAALLDIELRVPERLPWAAALVACPSRSEAVVFCVKDTVPEPTNEMVTFDHGGLTLRLRRADRPDVTGFLRSHSPPYRRASVAGRTAVGRDPGRALGPQTWPWPGEVRWWDEGALYELKGFESLAVLQEVAATVRPVTSP